MFAFSRKNHQENRAAIEDAANSLARYGVRVVHGEPIGSEQSPTAKIRAHIGSLISGRAYTAHEYHSPTLRAALETYLNNNLPQLIHLDSLDLYSWMPNLPPGPPITCTHHSIESELLRLRSSHVESRLLRRYLSLQADRVELVERRICPTFDLNLMMSDLDGSRLRDLAPGSQTRTIPNGVDVEQLRPSATPPVEGRVAFLGPTYMFPNRDAIDFLLDGIWQRILASVPSARLDLVGKVGDKEAVEFSGIDGVSCSGFVSDLAEHLAHVTCCVAPLRVGGGTRLKILDYWALGKAVVSTTVGCEGLDAQDGTNILIRDDPEEFADAVTSVLKDEDLRRRLEQNARETAVEIYSWEKVGDSLRQVYTSLIARGGGTADS